MTGTFSRRVPLALLSACLIGVLAVHNHEARAVTGAAAWEPALDCPDCNDFNSCTVDSCDTGTGTCRHDPRSCDDANPCTIDSCDPNFEIGGCRHAPAEIGTACDDGRACTLADVCINGICTAVPESPGSPCQDGNPCTTNDRCELGGNCGGTPAQVGSACDDGDSCTSSDVCTATGTGSVDCQGVRRSCDDGDACTVDSCNPSTGECAASPKSCEDGNACTADSCDPSSGQCLRSAVSGSCSDGTLCTTDDACSGGNCVGSPRVCSDIGCNDAQGCRWDRGCVYVPNPGLCGPGGECYSFGCSNGSCVTVPKSGQICHAGSLCQVGRCGGTVCNIEINLCNDFNPCTQDVCVDPATGTCGHANLDGGACNDGSICTTQDTCQGGTCAGAPIDCDDGLACTADSCDPAAGCVHAPLSGDSDGDGLPDACDNCPSVPNPDQNPCACAECIPLNITVTFSNPLGKGSGLVSWQTGIEHDLAGFNVVLIDNQGRRTQLNMALVPCNECITDQGSAYLFAIPKHKSGREIFIEQVHRDGHVATFGPAVKQ